MKKRALSIVLAICMVMTLLPMVSFAEEDVLESPDVYSDVPLADAKAYFNGSGTADDPFQIWTADDLYYINYTEYWRDVAAKETGSQEMYHYKQMDDIDLAGAARFDRETGYITANFGGVYDGGNFSISGMDKPLFYFTKGTYIGDADGAVFTDYQSGSSHDKVFTAIVRNVTLQEPNIQQSVATDVIEQIAAVAAYGINTVFYNIQVEGGEVNGVSGAASIVGRGGSVVLDNCTSSADTYASMHRASGMVSNLRIIDEKKSATTTSLVTNCTYSGNISGQMDGSRGAGGIVGGIYADGETTLNSQLPLYLWDNTFRDGSITLDLTGDSYMGGILGVSLGNLEWDIRNNTVSNVTMTAATNGFSLYTGALVGGIAHLGDSAVAVVEGNTIENVTMPVTRGAENVFAGQLFGSFSGELGSIHSISAEGTNIGDYGNLHSIWVTGDVGDIELPGGSAGTTVYVLGGGNVGRMYIDNTSTLSIYNYGTIGDIRNAGNINVYANTGTAGSITSTAGGISIGASNKSAATAEDYIGNAGGTIGNVSAGTSVNIYRNAGTIGDVASTTSSVAVGGNNDAEVYTYNTNSGAIGGISAGTSVTVYGNTASGTIAAAEGKSITAAGSVSIQGNAGQIGDVISTGSSVSVGLNNRSEDDNKGSMGNAGTIGNITSEANNISIYRNTGTIGDLTSDIGSVAIGTSAATYAAYNTNSGTIGAINAGTSAAIYGNNPAGEVGNVTAGTTVTIGSAAVLNQNTIGDIAADSTISIYLDAGAETGNIVRNGTTTANVNIGSAAAHNKGNVGDITNLAGGVTGYTEGTTGTINALTNTLLFGTASETGDVITTSGNITLSADATGNITVSSLAGQTFAGGSRLVLTATSTVTFGGDNPVALSGIQTTTALTLLDANGRASIGGIQSTHTITLGNGTAVFAGAITGDVTTTNSITLGNGNVAYYFAGTISGNLSGSSISINNAGTIGTENGGTAITATNGNISLTNGVKDDASKPGTVHSDLVNNSDGTTGTRSITLTNNLGSMFAGDILNNAGGGSTVKVTNNGSNIAGGIRNSGNGPVTLDSNYNGTTVTDDKFTGATVATGGNLVLSGLNPNEESKALQATLTDGASISAGNHSFYLTVSAAEGQTIRSLTINTTTTTVGRNTIDLTSLGTVQVTGAVGAGTTILPDSITPAGIGTLVTAAGNVVSNGTDVAQTNAYYAGGTLIVGGADNAAEKVSDGHILTLTGNSVNLYNYGTIGDIKHTGSSTLYIYNIGENAKIGNVTSDGSVEIRTNEGTVGDVMARVSVNVGLSNKMAAENNTTASQTIDYGNHGIIGSLTAETGAMNIYRNAAGASIEDITAPAGAIAIGQNNATYLGYNHNAGSIGNVKAGAAVSIYGISNTGSVAAADGQSVTAGTTLTIGASTAVADGYAYNRNAIGNVTAGTGVTIFNGDATIGTVTAGGSVSIGANTGTIGDVTSNLGSTNNTVTIGANNKTAANAGASVGNEGSIGKLTATAGGVVVYRNAEGARVGDIEAAGSVTVGQNSATYAAYNTNAGSVDNVKAGTSAGIYGTGANGSVSSVTTGTTVSIGAAAAPNQNTVGAVHSGTSTTIYNAADGSVGAVTAETSVNIGAATAPSLGSVDSVSAGTTAVVAAGEGSEIGNITAAGKITINANAGIIGDLESTAANIDIGAGSKTEANAAGVTGNTGTVGDVTAETGITVYRNTGTVGGLKAGTSVTIGQNTADTAISGFTTNSGSIGSVTAGTSVSIHSNAAGGKIAVDAEQSVTAGTTLAIGNAANQLKNEGQIGTATAGTTANMVNAGSMGPVAINGDSTSKLYIYDGAQPAGIQMSGGLLEVYDMTGTGSPAVNVAASGGKIEVIANEEGQTNVRVHVTATDGLTEGTYLTVRGALETVVHNGTGDVIMESADTSIATVVKNNTGEVLAYGSAGTVIQPDSAAGSVLSLAQVDTNLVEVRLVSAEGKALPAGSLTLTAITGGTMQKTDGSAIAADGVIAVSGGGLSELLGTVTVTGSTEVVVEASYTPTGGTAQALTARLAVTVPALVARIDTVFLTSTDDFNAAKAQYGWADTIMEPAEYPVLAVMPVTDEVFAQSAVEVTAAGAAVTNGVALIAVDMTDKAAGSRLTVPVTAALDGYDGYSGDASYTLTEVDIAKLDTDNTYLYVTYRYLDATTADKVVPVAEGESVMLEAPDTRTGYTFLGWSDGTATYTANTQFTPQDDVTLTAQWAASVSGQTYVLTLDVNGSGTVVRVEDGKEYPIASGTRFIAGTELALKANYTGSTRFDGWEVNGTTHSGNPITITMDGDQNVTAEFSNRSSGGSGGYSGSTYVISVGSVAHGSVVVSATRARRNSEITVTVKPDAGYELGSLVVADSKNQSVEVTETGDGVYTFVMPASRVVITAAFREITQEEGPTLPFQDVSTSDWFYEAVRFIYEEGLMNGIEQDTFGPNLTTTRAMIVTILYRMEGKPAASGNPFTDVADGAYYADAVAWAASNGIVEGYEQNVLFGPNDNITREQLAAILYRYAGYKGVDTSAAQNTDLTSYTDFDDISEYAVQALQWVIGSGLCNGKGDGVIDPRGNATRAEAAAFIQRYLQQ